ncbi:MAG: TetR/AcrR family transcriptional regulator [Sphingomonadales bacterium]|nr:TetR/AcrR family transcriptional regulator [Sphingomonadales bacterium]
MIDMAVRLLGEKGAEGLSIVALARAMGVSRGTVYYHFDSREALLAGVKAWASDQLARGMDTSWTVPERTAGICRIVLENPELFKLWIDDFIAGADIRDSYRLWDAFVAGMQRRFDTEQPEAAIDAEVYGTIMLTAAFIAPRIFARSVRPDLGIDEIVERFVREQRRVLARDGLG